MLGRTHMIALAVTLLLGVLSNEACADGVEQDTAPHELIVLNWSQYLDPDLIANFEAKFNARVRQVYFASDDLREHMILETDGAGYDVVLVNGANVDTYRRRGWLDPLSVEEIPNLEHVYSHWLDIHPGVRGYAVPYFWGTLGIAYRKDLVTESITSWQQLFEPAQHLHGKIGMIDSSRDVIGMALKALGYSANSSESSELREAERLLLAQRPFVNTYDHIDLSKESAMVSGEVVAAMLYNGDALMLQQYSPDIEYVVPSEGGNLWVDYWTVLATSTNKKLARDFINFLNEPDIAKTQAEFVYYATTNRAAERLLPKEFLADPVIYPSSEVLEKCEAYTQLSPRKEKQRNMIIMRVLD